MSNIENQNEELWLKHENKIDSMVKSTVGYSKKNLLKNEATTQTITGVTFTVNSDNSVTVNGTNTGSGNAKFKIATFTYKANEKYILNGCPTGGSVESGYCIQSEDTVSHHDVGEGIEISYDNEKANYIYIRVTSGATVNNVTFKPMIRYASIQDDTYEPYVEDVQTLIDKIFDISGVHNITGILSKNNRGCYCLVYRFPFYVNTDLYNINLDWMVAENTSGTQTLTKQAGWFEYGSVIASTTSTGYEGCMARAQITITKK